MKMTKEQIEKVENAEIVVENGKSNTVKEWLIDVSNKMPNSIKHKEGKLKNKSVNHYDYLLKIFIEKGRPGVLEYINQCYDLLDIAIKNKFDAK